MKKIEGRKTLKGKQVLRKNRDREYKDTKYTITVSDITSLAKEQQESKINVQLGKLNELENNHELER